MTTVLLRRCVWSAAALVGSVLGCGALVSIVPGNVSGLFTSGGSLGAVGQNLFTAIQIDPKSEDSSGPQILETGDLNGDGLMDVVTAWNQSNPIQIHLQRRIDGDIRFETVTLAGDVPTAYVAGLGIADMDGDGRADVVALIKNTGLFARCRSTGGTLADVEALSGRIIVYFGPDDPDDVTNALLWEAVSLNQAETAGAGPLDFDSPETGGYTDMELADINGDNLLDIVVAWNPNDCEELFNRIEYYANPGPATARQDSAWAPFLITSNAPAVKALSVVDIDRDGDLDVVYTFPELGTQNVSWSRNPRIDVPDAFHITDGTWAIGSVGEVRTGADIIDTGDIDQDGFVDVVVRSTGGKVIQWFKGPQHATTFPVRNIPWQVYTLAEFINREPKAIDLGDLDGDGELELVASAGGAVIWLERFSNSTVFNQWSESLLIDDSPEFDTTPSVTDPNVDLDEIALNGTLINTVKIVDLDGDGRPDVLATLNRRAQSGLTNDAIVWFRNNGL